MRRPETIVYLVGVIMLGMFYAPLRATVSPTWLFIVCVVVCLTALRGVGWLIKKRGT